MMENIIKGMEKRRKLFAIGAAAALAGIVALYIIRKSDD